MLVGSEIETIFDIVESMLTSNKRLEDFIYLNKIKTEILNPDWLKKGKYLSLNICLFSFYPFSLTPLVGTSHRPDIIRVYFSLSTPLLFSIDIYVRL